MVIGFSYRIIKTPVFCAAFAAVIGFYCLYHAAFALTAAVLSVLVIALCLFRVLSSLNPSRNLRITSGCFCALAVGLAIGVCAGAAGSNEIKFGIPEDKITALECELLEDPRVIAGGSAMAPARLRKSAGANGLRVTASGEITVFFRQESAQKLREAGRGTVVFAEGALRSGDRGYSLSAHSLHIVKPAPQMERMRTNIRLNLIKRFDGKPWGGLALALLLGVRDNLDVEFTSLYRTAGLSYILALSGMHLAIIAALIAFLLKKPLGLKMSAVIGAVIIIMYCMFVGPFPSLYRSALMYVIGTAVIIFALPRNSMAVLSLSFLIQLIITPAAGNSISFILSYLALAGILIIGKAFSALLAGKIPDFLLQPLSLSCGAFLATSGICSFTFGYIAPIGIIAGLAVVPLTTIFMTGSIIWLALDFLSLSFILNLPLFLIYRLMEITASTAGFVPGIRSNPALVLAVSISLMILIAALEYKRRLSLRILKPFV